MILDKKKPRFLKRKCTVGQGDNGPQNMIIKEMEESDDPMEAKG